MTTLFHLTWSDYVPAIIKEGLKPNAMPSGWVMQAAVKRSNGKVFLCSAERKSYWQMTYQDGWVNPPSKDSKIVWLKVNIRGLKLFADKAKGEHYEGDYWTRQAIASERISV